MIKTNLNPNIYISTGNKKLKENSKSYFLIWNLPAIKTCPYSTALCEKSCYARKAERLYPQVLPARDRNFLETFKDTFIVDMIQHIDYHVNRPKNKGKQCYFRIHESGDFYSEDYMIKWIKIAYLFPEVQFMAYTKSVTFLYSYIANGGQVPDNMIFRFSVWDDTNPDYIHIAQNLDLPIYTAFDKKVLDDKLKKDKYFHCLCDCQNCKVCYTPCSRIATAIH